jgi:stage III sporulation protein AG
MIIVKEGTPMKLFDKYFNFVKVNEKTEDEEKDKSKKKKPMPFVLVSLVIGVVLLIASSMFSSRERERSEGGDMPPAYQPPVTNTTQSVDEFITKTEQRLEEILSLIDGAGKVRVMVSVSGGKEIVVAETAQSESSTNTERDSQGGTRDSASSKDAEQYVFVRQKDGSEVPLILKELVPKIMGVAIVAEGGDNIVVRDALIRTAYVALGIDAHRVFVSKMTNIR